MKVAHAYREVSVNAWNTCTGNVKRFLIKHVITGWQGQGYDGEVEELKTKP